MCGGVLASIFNCAKIEGEKRITVEPPYNGTPRSGQTLSNGQTVGNGVFSACM